MALERPELIVTDSAAGSIPENAATRLVVTKLALGALTRRSLRIADPTVRRY